MQLRNIGILVCLRDGLEIGGRYSYVPQRLLRSHKCLGSGGGVVARLKLTGIIGRTGAA